VEASCCSAYRVVSIESFLAGKHQFLFCCVVNGALSTEENDFYCGLYLYLNRYVGAWLLVVCYISLLFLFKTVFYFSELQLFITSTP
jgi:hypothetical protein